MSLTLFHKMACIENYKILSTQVHKASGFSDSRIGGESMYTCTYTFNMLWQYHLESTCLDDYTALRRY